MQLVDDPNQEQKTTTKGTQQPEYYTPEEPRRYFLTGIALILLGVFFFIDRATDWYFPLDVFQWEWMLIIAGIYLGEKHHYTGMAWIACISIGTWFIIDDHVPDVNLKLYFVPLLIICFGIYLLVGKKRSRPRRNTFSYRNIDHAHYQTNQQRNEHGAAFSSQDGLGEDYLDVVSIFGGSKKNVITKSFKGGEAVSVFGGTELNLSQADFEGQVILELTQIFGGCTLIIPPHWDLKRSEMVSIFGGVEDNRPTTNTAVDHRKQLILRGTNIFGGIEIKSF